MRDDLMILVAGNPLPGVQALAQELAVRVHNSIVGGSTLVRRVLRHQDFDRSLEDVKSEYVEAQLKAAQLQAAISERSHPA